jgi:two-component system OmpR family sensor kinase
MKRVWLTPIAILIGALIVAALLDWWIPSLPVLAFQIDIGSLLIVVGLLIAIFVSIVIYFQLQTQAKYEHERQEALTERRSFLRRLDHELKNPITAIFMGLANLKNSLLSTQEQEYLDIIDAHTRRLQRLTSDLRKLADLKTMEMEMVPVDLTDLLQETLHYVQEAHAHKGRSFSLVVPEVPWPLPKVRGDYDLLQLAVHNLLENAVKFSQTDDAIELRASEDGSEVLIEIADTGRGIPDAEQQHVWQELYRGANAQSISGSGLGLALTRAIIERHNGTISLRSRELEGTIVSIRLPAN